MLEESSKIIKIPRKFLWFIKKKNVIFKLMNNNVLQVLLFFNSATKNNYLFF